MKLGVTNDKIKNRSEESNRITSIQSASSSNTSFWLSKFTMTNISSLFQYSILQQKVIYKKPRVIAADGTMISVHLPNKFGTSKASLTICSLIDIHTKIFIDYAISDSNHERDCLKQQLTYLSRKDIIIADRNYGKYDLIAHMHNRVGFIVRLSRNLNIYKRIINSNKSSMIINWQYNGQNIPLKLIKYVISKKTSKRVIQYMDNIGELDTEDHLSMFVICTKELWNNYSYTFDNISSIMLHLIENESPIHLNSEKYYKYVFRTRSSTIVLRI